MVTRPDKARPRETRLSRRALTRQAYEREHRIAECLQRVLLRSSPQEALPGVSVEAYYEAALAEATVGGDGFDAFGLGDGQVALTVADASGKGLDAAERVAEVRFALRAFLREHGDPGQALACLNDFVCTAQRLGERDEGAFVTLTLVVLDCRSGHAQCLCAGGEPPLVLRAGGTTETDSVCGPALGLFPAQKYVAAALRLDPGDVVLLATDGLTEARRRATGGNRRDRTGAFLEITGLARLAVKAWASAKSLPQIGSSIFEGARRFAGGTFHDDACLLIAQRVDDDRK